MVVWQQDGVFEPDSKFGLSGGDRHNIYSLEMTVRCLEVLASANLKHFVLP